MKIFGIEFKSSRNEVVSPIPTDPTENGSSIVVDSIPGSFAASVSAISVDNMATTENGYIEQYRSLIGIPEVAQCVQEITSEAIIYPDDGSKAVELDLSNLEISEATKTKIIDAFDTVYDLLMFGRRGYDIFKRWYIDGRLYYFVNIDNEDTSAGIQSIQYVDPRKIKRVREISRAYDGDSRVLRVIGERSYYIYNERGIGSSSKQSTMNSGAPGQLTAAATNSDLIISEDSVVYVPSGEIDPQSGFVIGHLHTSIRTANNLRMMEDAVLIYRLSRAPERRVFYVDTGNLPKAKGEQYVEELARKHRSKIVYDASTGEIKNDKKFLALTEDFWLPRREGSTGTAIDVLAGGAQVGEMGESEYFKDKLYTALGVPASRFENPAPMFQMGSAITRDELRFGRIIAKYRTNFSMLFEELLRMQCILTNIMSAEDWEECKNRIIFKFAEDNHFSEAIKQERLRGVSEMLQSFDQFVGKYFSREYIYKNIIGMTDDEMKEEQKLISADTELQKELAADEEQPQVTEDIDFLPPGSLLSDYRDMVKSIN